MTPLRQALREADEALTGTLLAKMQDVEAARATVRLKKAAQDLLAALDASATTGRETCPHGVPLDWNCNGCSDEASPPPDAPPATPDTKVPPRNLPDADWEWQATTHGDGLHVCLWGRVDSVTDSFGNRWVKAPAPRRAETPTLEPPSRGLHGELLPTTYAAVAPPDGCAEITQTAEPLTDSEREELDGLLADVMLPTFTPRERFIARKAARAAYRHGKAAAPSPAPPEGPRDAAPAPATCATCEFHNPNGPLCQRLVGRPNTIWPGLRTDKDHFGCTLHQPRPVSADGAPGVE